MGPCIPPVDPVFQQHVWTCAVHHKQAVATDNLIHWKHISLELQKMTFCGKLIFPPQSPHGAINMLREPLFQIFCKEQSSFEMLSLAII